MIIRSQFVPELSYYKGEEKMLRNVEHDFVMRILAAADTKSIRALLGAFRENRVIRRAYQKGRSGCVLYFLFGVTSRKERRDCFEDDEQLLAATEELITSWDDGEIDEQTVIRSAKATLRARTPRIVQAMLAMKVDFRDMTTRPAEPAASLQQAGAQSDELCTPG